MPRSRGVFSGLLLVLFGAWGALMPFYGARIGFAYSPDTAWSAARGWLEVAPGAAAALGGLMLIVTHNRAVAMFGGAIAAAAGAWFVLGTTVAPLLNIPTAGEPVADDDTRRALLHVGYFSGVGVLIVFVAGAVLARVSPRQP